MGFRLYTVGSPCYSIMARSTPYSEPILQQDEPHPTSQTPTNNYNHRVLQSISWSDDSQYIASAAGRGFQIHFLSDLHTPTSRRKISEGSFSVVDSLPQYNLVALDGDADNKQFPPNRLQLWDDKLRFWAGSFDFKHAVHGVKLTKDRIIVVLTRQVRVYNMSTHKCVHIIVTTDNPSGLWSVSYDPGNFVMTFPGR